MMLLVYQGKEKDKQKYHNWYTLIWSINRTTIYERKKYEIIF